MNHHILLIEDNLEMADNIVSILELAKYKVVHAPNGKIGVDLAQQNHPDLILCDIMMPELDGYGVRHILTKDPDTANIPFVFLTAKSDQADVRTGMNLGADDYLTKPFDITELLSVVETRIKKNEHLKGIDHNAKTSGVFFNSARELKELQKLKENRTLRSFKKRDLLFMEGQTPNDLYLIQKGRVKTVKINHDGKELITGIYQPGEFLGFVPLLEDKPYNENAEVMEDTIIAIIPKLEFIELIYSSKDIMHKFIKLLSNNVEELENRLLDVAYQSVRQRVASVLLHISSKLVENGNEGLITISRKELSNLVGTATESLNRTLADFKDEGLIEIMNDGLRIINKTKLEKLIH